MASMRVSGRFFLFTIILFSHDLSAFQPATMPFSWESLSNQYMVRHYTVEDGLPINAVNYMAHHTDGFLFLATNDGLAKFDGDRFLTINTSGYPALQTNRISVVTSMPNGELWLVDAEGNIYLFKNEKLSWLQEQEAFNQVIIKKIEQYNDGQVIITSEEGIYIQTEDITFRQFQYQKTREGVRNTFKIGDETVYLFRDDGVYVLKNEQLTKLFDGSDILMSVNEVYNMIITSDGTIWLLGYNSQLLEISTDFQQKLHTYNGASNIEFWDFIEWEDGQLWISTSTGYLGFNRETNSFFHSNQISADEEYFEDNAWNKSENHLITKLGNSVFIDGEEILRTDKSITYISPDNEGNIWVATNGDGLYQLVPKKVITLGETTFPGLSNIYGIAERNGEIWAASFEHEIFRITDTEITNWNKENSAIEYPYFRSIFPKEDIVYAGNFNLLEFTNNSWRRNDTWELGSELLDVLFIDNSGRFWIGTNENLFLNQTTSIEKYFDKNGIGIQGVKSIQNYKDGEVIIATGQQGLAFLSKENEFRFASKEDGLSSNIIRDVYLTSEDTMWVVTEDQGLNRVILNAEGDILKIHYLTANEGLIDNSLHRLLKDEFGFFWINSNKGIMRISERKLNKYLDGEIEELHVKKINAKSGLENIEGNGGTQSAGILTSNGNLLFPNQAGIVFTRPEWHVKDIGITNVSPVFESVFFSDSSVSVSGNQAFTLPKSVREIQVKFTAPTFSEPDKLQLEYKMTGVNTEWQRAGVERTAVFTNLPAGENQLMIRAKIEGNSKFSEQQIEIFAPPYYYETGWFKILMVFGLGLLFAVGYKVLLLQARLREKRLNDLVYERTLELVDEKEKTERALKQVQKLDESKSRFFTNFTHELRTPLSLILSPLEDMLDGEVTGNGNRESLTMIQRNAHRLKDLVSQLLDVSKLNAGEMAMTFEEVAPGKLTRRFLTQFEHAFSKKKIQLKFEEEPGLSNLYLDVNAWNHICTNLLGNALKFTPEEGQVNIQISEKEEWVVVRFEDTGIGISQNDLPYVFDSYYQGDSSISGAEGTGIGLALVKGLVERMGGSVTVVSELSKGTTFTIRLKKGKSHIKTRDTIQEYPTFFEESVKLLESGKVDVEPGYPKSKKRILLVEDNEDFRSYLHSVIGRHYHIEVAENGKKGLELLPKVNPDLIVSDIMMPEMDGYGMMREIRKKKKFQNIPFIFLSAKDSKADIEKGLNIGADIYLPKPVENKLLLLQIKVLLRREEQIIDSGSSKEKKVSPLVKNVEEIIHRHLGNPALNVELIADALSMSSPTLYRKWQKESDVTINHTIAAFRFEEALKLIEEESLTISEAAYSVGFSHLSYFSKAFKKMYGVPPQEYIKVHSDE